jgi:ATP-dependent DNA helicase HFM1/MER3
MISSGIAFHNAALSVEDRSIIINEFIKQNIKIICTTSTLSQGMNLPARLVIIKGTLAYRGSGKGYT